MELVGKKIKLTPITDEMITQEYVSWLNDAEVNQFMESGKFPVDISQARQYVQDRRGSTTALILGIVELTGKKFIGTTTLAKIDPLGRTAGLGIMIGNRAEWGKGYGREAMQLLMKLAYEHLNLRKIYLYVVEGNPAAGLYRSEGFQDCGVLKKQVFVRGEYRDYLIMEHFNKANP